ncbi:TetR/AcrR family transcriptional regulator [Myxosarcina sp. GI1(2024)]
MNTDKAARQQQPNSKRSHHKAAQILHGALPEFLEHGYSRTSMDKIARSAGVSKQTLYSYYSDKDGLFTALIQELVSQKFQLLCSETLTGEPVEVLRQIAARLLQGIQDTECLNLVRLIVAESGTRPNLSQLFLTNVSQPAITMLTKYFQTETRLHFSDPETVARIFIGSLIYYIMSQEVLHEKETTPIKSDRYVNNLIDLIVN